MTALATELRVVQPDDAYQLLVDAYAGLPDQNVATFHACLVLLLINQVGDAKVIHDAIAEALRVTRQRKNAS